MTQNSSNQKKIIIDFRLTQRQRVILATVLTLVSVIALSTGVLFFYSRNTAPKDVTLNNDELNSAITNLSGNLSSLNPEDLFYQAVTFEDLDIYPSGWVARNFTTSEQANKLISSQGADPDKDGLSNKLEFIYGSNPNQVDSLCNGTKNGDECVGRTDKQNVDANISPLTGLPLDEASKTFSINFQNKAVIESLKNSFDNASKDGLDFPTLYQLSKTVDYMDQIDQIIPITEPETRQNLLDYTQFQVDQVNGILGSSELQSLSKIYSLVVIDDLQNQKNALEKKLKEIQDYVAPDSASKSHKLYIFIFKQLVQLVSLRLDAIKNANLETDSYQKNAKQAAIAVAWAYRKLNEKSIVKSPNL